MIRFGIGLAIILLFVTISTFPQASEQKRQASQMMQSGRFSEAVDLLNKFLAQNPRDAEGYNMRGICFERRGEHEKAYYDFEAAKKIQPKNAEYKKNFDRLWGVWQKLLRDKIKGHEREIAINPNKAVNYLEIGKCHRKLGAWLLAEEWYDKYLARQEASSDEIIRYTEILARNNHIVKGEIVLKKYTNKYPNDHRLQSRYGYFTMWLGKGKIAEAAFLKALALRPYFKEAQDGLDQLKGRYFNQLYADEEKSREVEKKQKQQEYLIDKLYRELKQNPADDKKRLLLVQELFKVSRLEEAYNELIYLQSKLSGKPEYDSLYVKVSANRTKVYTEKLENLLQKYAANPDDNQTLFTLVELYALMDSVDVGLGLAEDYFTRNPESTDNKLRFKYAMLLAQQKRNFESAEEMDKLLVSEPENLEYQLFRGLLFVWAEEGDLDRARTYFENALKKDPKRAEALIGMAVLETKKDNFDAAEKMLAKVKKEYPTHPEIPILESNIAIAKSAYEQKKLYESLEVAREDFRNGNCESAIAVYDEFMAKYPPSRLIRKEYADINICLKNYDKALTVYDELIAEEPDPLLELERAKLFYYKADYPSAATELKKQFDAGNVDFSADLFLGDSYAQMQLYDDAYDHYERMLAETTDSSKIELIKLRIGWLPVTGFRAIFQNFPTYVSLRPVVSFFSDNTGFEYFIAGTSIEAGIFSYLSLGGTFQTNFVATSYNRRTFSTTSLDIILRPQDYVQLGFSFGQQKFTYPNYSTGIFDAYLAVLDPDSMYRAQVLYLRRDAATILYSASLVSLRWAVQLYRFSGYYITPGQFKISTVGSYIEVADGNTGNIFELRLGKYIVPELLFGYEYFLTNFSRKSAYYYSPKSDESHSAFADWNFLKFENVSVSMGGRVGLLPENSYILKELYGDIKYYPLDNLLIQAHAQAGNTVRDAVGYASDSFAISAYWNF